MPSSSLRWAGLLGLLWSLHASAAPIVALDLDTGTPGVQAFRSIATGQSFDLDVLLDTDGAELGGFEFDLFPGGIGGQPVTATGITVAEYWGAGPDFTEIDGFGLDNGSGEAFAAAVVGFDGLPPGAPGFHPLARLTYLGVTPGLVSLLLNNVLLADLAGDPLQFTTADGRVEVVSAPVPATPGLVLVAVGLAALSGVRTRAGRALVA